MYHNYSFALFGVITSLEHVTLLQDMDMQNGCS